MARQKLAVRWAAPIVALLVLALTVTVGFVASSGRQAATPIAAALATVPADSGTVDLTVWERIDTSASEANLAGLANRSTLIPLAESIDEQLGFSLTDLGWEMFARTTAGQVTVIDLAAIDAAAVQRRFEKISENKDARVLKVDPAKAQSRDLTTIFAHVRILESRRLLVAGNSAKAVNRVVRTINGSGRSMLSNPSIAEMAANLTDHASVMLRAREAWCGTSPPDEADALAVRTAERGRAPLVDPRWGARGLSADGKQITFAISFDTSDVARRQLPTRRALTQGPMVGRTGDVADQLTDSSITANDATIAFSFGVRDEAEDFMVDIAREGFNGCASTSPS